MDIKNKIKSSEALVKVVVRQKNSVQNWKKNITVLVVTRSDIYFGKAFYIE